MNQYEEKVDAKSTYLDLVRQRQRLEEQIDQARERAQADVVASIVKLILEYKLTIRDIREGLAESRASPASGARRQKTKHVVKYLDPASGRTWSGRGPVPKWLEGKCLDDYLLGPGNPGVSEALGMHSKGE